MGTPESNAVLVEALGHFQRGQHQDAVNLLASDVEANNLPAILATAWINTQRGDYLGTIPLAKRALQLGSPLPGLWIVSTVVSQPEERPFLFELIRHVEDFGPPFDPIQYWGSVAASGDLESAAQLFHAAARPPIPALRSQLDEILAQSQQAGREIENNVAASEARHNEAVEKIQGYEAAVEAERDRATQLVAETGSLVHGATAAHVAKAYQDKARSTMKAARLWTATTIVIGLVAVGWAAFVAYHAVSTGQELGESIAKALVSLPLVLIASYTGAIAQLNRRMAWHWSHVELQIRTSEPFIASLDADTQNRLLAALAIRFFPGQGQDPLQTSQSTENLDVGTLIAAILRELAPGSRLASGLQVSGGGTTAQTG